MLILVDCKFTILMLVIRTMMGLHDAESDDALK